MHVFILSYAFIYVTELNMAILAQDAIKKFNVKLLRKLPLDDPIFFGMLKEANLLPLDSADNIAAQSTKANKVSYFLQHVVEPGPEVHLPKLLEVMKNSENDDVIKLAHEIHATINPGIYIYLCNSVVYVRM